MNEHHKTEAYLRTELAIVEAAKSDPSKFGVLYEKYYRQVYVFVFRRIGDEDESGDIAANTFLKAMLALSKYTYRGVPFSAWLFRIASNEINLFFRKNNRERIVSLDKSDLSKIMVEGGENDSEENQKLLLRVLSTLTTEEMQLIELRFFEKRPFNEIGEIIGITENNAKVRTYRILEKLKLLLLKSGGR